MYVITTEYDELEVSSEPVPWAEVVKRLRKEPDYAVTGYRIARAE